MRSTTLPSLLAFSLIACAADDPFPVDATSRPQDGGVDAPDDAGRDASSDAFDAMTLDVGASDAASDALVDVAIDTSDAIDAGAPPSHCGGDPTVQRLGSPFECGASNAQCLRVRVDVPALPNSPAELVLRVHEPAAPRFAGTLLLGSGEGGITAYEDHTGPGFMRELTRLGYRVVDRVWSEDWRNNPGDAAGILATTCRYYAVARFVHEEFSADAPFCLSGNSGGSAEIAYALIAHNADAFVDAAVLSSGPPMGTWRLCDDYMDDADDIDSTGEPLDARWPAQCMSHLQTLAGADTPTGVRAAFECAPEPMRPMLERPRCAYPDGNRHGVDRNWGTISVDGRPAGPEVCADYRNGRNRMRSSELADMDLSTMTTPTAFLFASRDCTEAVPGGMNVALAIEAEGGAPSQIELVGNARHAMYGSDVGRRAILRRIMELCR